jgi:hypothetical protein
MVCNMIPDMSSISAAPTALHLNFNAFPGLTAWATVVTRLRRWHHAVPNGEKFHSMPRPSPDRNESVGDSTRLAPTFCRAEQAVVLSKPARPTGVRARRRPPNNASLPC